MLEPFAQKHGILYLAVTKSKHFLLFSWDKTARIVSQGGAFREACQARDTTTYLQRKSIAKVRF
ncbi:TPA: hypothetical protein I7792_04220 [Vibrio vulnificus]|nr:hypothetical protein [Vibrio vulnificus]